MVGAYKLLRSSLTLEELDFGSNDSYFTMAAIGSQTRAIRGGHTLIYMYNPWRSVDIF